MKQGHQYDVVPTTLLMTLNKLVNLRLAHVASTSLLSLRHFPTSMPWFPRRADDTVELEFDGVGSTAFSDFGRTWLIRRWKMRHFSYNPPLGQRLLPTKPGHKKAN